MTEEEVVSSEELFEMMQENPQFVQVMMAGIGQQFKEMVGLLLRQKSVKAEEWRSEVERDLNDIEKGDPVFVVVSKIEKEKDWEF